MSVTAIPKLSNRLPKPYIQPDKREKKAMTIALGFFCMDGVVLCSDSQVTTPGHMKYHESKIRAVSWMSEEANWTVGLTYSGDPDVMRSLFDKMNDALSAQGSTLTQPFVVETLQQALIEVHTNSANIDTEYVDIICGIVINGESSMYVGKRTTLHRERGAAILGVGDSSLSRFLVSTLPVSRMFSQMPVDTKTAQLLGVYIIEQAKLFIDGCGGDTYVTTIHNDRMCEEWDNKHSQHLDELTVLAKNMQRRAQELFALLTDADDQKIGVFENAVRATKKQVEGFYGLGLG
jgi:hypothetical protein